MIRVLLADDHSILRQGLRLILNEVAEFTVVGEATNGEEVVALALKLEPDVILMDVGMPGLDGIEATRRIRAIRPQTHVLMLTVSDDDQHLLAAVKAGARGYLLKNAEAAQVQEAIRQVAAGEAILPSMMIARVLDELSAPAPQPQKLTERELDILVLIARGLGNKEIAATLCISQNTVKTHVRHILEKLNLSNRAEAAAYAVRAGLVTGD